MAGGCWLRRRGGGGMLDGRTDRSMRHAACSTAEAPQASHRTSRKEIDAQPQCGGRCGSSGWGVAAIWPARPTSEPSRGGPNEAVTPGPPRGGGPRGKPRDAARAARQGRHVQLRPYLPAALLLKRSTQPLQSSCGNWGQECRSQGSLEAKPKLSSTAVPNKPFATTKTRPLTDTSPSCASPASLIL